MNSLVIHLRRSYSGPQGWTLNLLEKNIPTSAAVICLNIQLRSLENSFSNEMMQPRHPFKCLIAVL